MQARATQRIDLLQGTLDLLVLKTLSWGPEHGFGISTHIRQVSGNLLQVEQGSLYPALQRLEQQGLIASQWGVSDNHRKAKFYRLTPAGRGRLSTQTADWAKISQVINLILDTV
jgi:PadR family transcriptional regulator PadR